MRHRNWQVVWKSRTDRNRRAGPRDVSVRDDSFEKARADAAAEAAFETVNERFDIELEDRNWIEHGSEVLSCPDPEFDFAEALAALPRTVSVTVHREGKDDPYECVHEMLLEGAAYPLR